jgi:hypothetical protein
MIAGRYRYVSIQAEKSFRGEASREEAARYVGVSATKFDAMVGRAPFIAAHLPINDIDIQNYPPKNATLGNKMDLQ